MTPDNLQYFAKLLQEQTGVVVGPDKAYLLESRLGPVCRRFNLASVDALIQAIRGDCNLPAARAALNALMTHESFFFRDAHPFEEFRKTVLPGLCERRAATRTIRIWCAAASTGQEPYSLAMILREEMARLAGWKVEIVATDISPVALAYAREGLYTQFEVQRGLPIQALVKHFAREGEQWRVAPALKEMVSYREFNLLHDPAPLGRFDVVFCRNVLIYFDPPTKQRILDRIARQMAEDGCLFLGGAETVVGVTERFALMPDKRGIYVPATGVKTSRVA